MDFNANGMTDDEQATFDRLYGSQPSVAQPAAPGWFARAYAGLGFVPSAAANIGLDAAQTVVNEPLDLAQPYTTDTRLASSGTLQPLHPSGVYYPQLAGSTLQEPAALAGMQDFAHEADQWIGDTRATADDLYRPDPLTTGAVGNTLFNLGEPLARIGLGTILTGGAGALEIAASSMGYERAQQAQAQGVDANTAAMLGLTDAAAFEALGAVGNEGSLATRILKLGAVNESAGIAQRGLDHEILAANGYDKLAEQEKWNDAQAILSNALISIAFPLVHEGYVKLKDVSATLAENRLAADILAGRKPAEWESGIPSELVNSALTSLNAKHAADTAPGIPTDPQSQGLHYKALDAAIMQALNAEPVDVEPITRGMNTIPRPVDPAKVEGITEALTPEPEADPYRYAERDESGTVTGYRNGDNFIPAFTNLTDAQREVEARAAGQVLDDPEAAIAAYAKIRNSKGENTTNNGSLINTDEARELFTDYNASPEARSMNALAVHEPASWIAKKVWERALARPVRDGKFAHVFFTRGGTGAGKSTGPKHLSELGELQSASDIVYDGNLNGFESATKKIDAALASGRKVRILYTFRDPVQSFVHGALPRAERPDYGRTVPIPVHVDTHVGAAETYLRLKEHYKNNPDVDIQAIHNDYVPKERADARSKITSPFPDEHIVALANTDRDILESEVRDAFERERQAGRVSDRVYYGTLGIRPRGPDDDSSGPVGEVQGVPWPPSPRPAGSVRGPGQVSDLNPAAGGVSASGPLMQNRDRARAASLTQMAGIANAPDAQRLGFSRDPNTGAPMVSAENAAQAVPAADLGKEDVVIFADGRKIPVRYAVVEAGDVQASHHADGSVNPDYNGAPLQALNNGRVAGVQAAWKGGNGDAYKAGLVEDASTFGIDPKAIADKANPMVIRLYDAAANFGDMGKASNESGALGLSPSEQALTDARALPDLDTLPLTESGEISNRADDPFHRQFLRNLGVNDAAKLVDSSGRFNKTYLDRLRAALFARAYGDPQLVEMQTESTDPVARNVLNGLTAAAPEWAKIDQGAPLGDYATRLTAAMNLLREAHESGETVAQRLAQGDLIARDHRGDAWANFFAEHARSPKRISEALRDAARMIVQEQRRLLNGDLIGGGARSESDITQAVLKIAEDRYGNERPQPTGSLFNAAGRATRDALRQPGTAPAGSDADVARNPAREQVEGERAQADDAAAAGRAAPEPGPADAPDAGRPAGAAASGLSDGADAEGTAGATGEAGGTGPAGPRRAAQDQEGQPGTSQDTGADRNVARAREAITQRPDLMLPDGVSAAEAMRQADEAVAQAEKDAAALKAAVDCFLQFGSDAA